MQKFTREAKSSILDVPMVCPECGWLGIVGSAVADVDGDGSLGCPKCGSKSAKIGGR